MSLVQTLKDYRSALKEAQQETTATGFWHVDECYCERCRRLERWLDLPWQQKLWARIAIARSPSDR